MLFAEYGTFQIAEEPTNPRLAAMGSAGTAMSGNGFACYNPASPAFADAPFLTIEYGSEPDGLSKSMIASSWMFPKWFAGASLVTRTTDWQTANEQGVGTLMSYQSTLATVNGGFIIGRFASGHTINLINERIGDMNYSVITYCPGVMFKLVPERITIGASLLHYLRVDTFGGQWYKAPSVWYRSARGYLPRYARAGVTWSDTLRRWSLPFIAACDFVYSDVYERFMAPLGVEAWLLPSIAVRTGVCINHPTQKVHFGVGIRWNSLECDFDYGITQPPVTGADYNKMASRSHVFTAASIEGAAGYAGERAAKKGHDEYTFCEDNAACRGHDERTTCRQDRSPGSSSRARAARSLACISGRFSRRVKRPRHSRKQSDSSTFNQVIVQRPFTLLYFPDDPKNRKTKINIKDKQCLPFFSPMTLALTSVPRTP